jgi:anti-sigma B factor antagonist
MGIYRHEPAARRAEASVPLTITIDELAEAWVLSARGELDYGECAAFRMSIDNILRARPAALVVDFSEVEYLDSSGLGLLLSLSQEYGAGGGRQVLVTNETVDGVLDITRLGGVFTIRQDADSALAYLRETAPPDEGDARP